MPCAEQELKFEYLFDYKSVNAKRGQSVEEVTAMAQCETEVEDREGEGQTGDRPHASLKTLSRW